jgi:hypothetical protein
VRWREGRTAGGGNQRLGDYGAPSQALEDEVCADAGGEQALVFHVDLRNRRTPTLRLGPDFEVDPSACEDRDAAKAIH